MNLEFHAVLKNFLNQAPEFIGKEWVDLQIGNFKLSLGLFSQNHKTL